MPIGVSPSGFGISCMVGMGAVGDITRKEPEVDDGAGEVRDKVSRGLLTG